MIKRSFFALVIAIGFSAQSVVAAGGHVTIVPSASISAEVTASKNGGSSIKGACKSMRNWIVAHPAVTAAVVAVAVAAVSCVLYKKYVEEKEAKDCVVVVA